jgi:hypothetical protein
MMELSKQAGFLANRAFLNPLSALIFFPVKIALPTPSPEHVERFRALIFELYGVSLGSQESYDQCQRLVHYLYYTQYALPALRAQKQRE